MTNGYFLATAAAPQDEVDRMVNEADRYGAEDKAKREAVETKNNAESMVYQTEKQVKELGDKVRLTAECMRVSGGGRVMAQLTVQHSAYVG